MTLEDLIARRNALLAELKSVRAEIKSTKAASPKRDKLNQIQATARKNLKIAIALRRKGLTYKEIGEKIGRSGSHVRCMVVIAEREE